jgi:hypothetical protein
MADQSSSYDLNAPECDDSSATADSTATPKRTHDETTHTTDYVVWYANHQKYKRHKGIQEAWLNYDDDDPQELEKD